MRETKVLLIIAVAFLSIGKSFAEELKDTVKEAEFVFRALSNAGEIQGNGCSKVIGEQKLCKHPFEGAPSRIKTDYDCLANGNFLECYQVKEYFNRFKSGMSEKQSSEFRSIILGKIKRLEEYMASHPSDDCVPNLDQLKSSLCFLKGNLDEISFKQYGGKDFLVVEPLGEQRVDLVIETKHIKKYGRPSYINIVKKGKDPFEQGKFNTVGSIQPQKRVATFDDPKYNTTAYDYHGRKVISEGFTFGPTLQVPFASFGSYGSCNSYHGVQGILRKSTLKLKQGWDPDKANKLARQSISAGAIEGFELGAYNLYDAGEGLVSGVIGLWDLVWNNQVPDPNGTEKCIDPKMGKTCSGMRDLLVKALGEGINEVFGTCTKKACGKTSEFQCLNVNAGNPVFQIELASCVTYELGAKAYNGVKEKILKCASNANEASRCFADLAVFAASSATGLSAVKGLQTVSQGSVITAKALVRSGKLTASQARSLVRVSKTIVGSTAFVTEMTLNQLPADPKQLLKLKKIGEKILKKKNLDPDIKKKVTAYVEDIDDAIQDLDKTKVNGYADSTVDLNGTYRPSDTSHFIDGLPPPCSKKCITGKYVNINGKKYKIDNLKNLSPEDLERLKKIISVAENKELVAKKIKYDDYKLQQLRKKLRRMKESGASKEEIAEVARRIQKLGDDLGDLKTHFEVSQLIEAGVITEVRFVKTNKLNGDKLDLDRKKFDGEEGIKPWSDDKTAIIVKTGKKLDFCRGGNNLAIGRFFNLCTDKKYKTANEIAGVNALDQDAVDYIQKVEIPANVEITIGGLGPHVAETGGARVNKTGWVPFGEGGDVQYYFEKLPEKAKRVHWVRAMKFTDHTEAQIAIKNIRESEVTDATKISRLQKMKDDLIQKRDNKQYTKPVSESLEGKILIRDLKEKNKIELDDKFNTPDKEIEKYVDQQYRREENYLIQEIDEELYKLGVQGVKKRVEPVFTGANKYDASDKLSRINRSTDEEAAKLVEGYKKQIAEGNLSPEDVKNYSIIIDLYEDSVR